MVSARSDEELLRAVAMEVSCPRCGAPAGELNLCRLPYGAWRDPHRERLEAFLRKIGQIGREES